jgi:hypothetical protein
MKDFILLIAVHVIQQHCPWLISSTNVETSNSGHPPILAFPPVLAVRPFMAVPPVLRVPLVLAVPSMLAAQVTLAGPCVNEA